MPDIRYNFSESTPAASSHPIEWTKTLGTIINNTHRGYWLSKSDEEHGFDESFERLLAAFSVSPAITLSVFKDVLHVNDDVAPESDGMIQVVIDHMVRCDITDFSISNSVTRSDYGRFLDIISLKPLQMGVMGGFVKLVTDAQLPAIRVLKVVYKRVAENETVISQDALKAAGTGLGEAITRQILELLSRGESATEGTIDALALVSQDPHRMAELILDSVQKESSADADPAPASAVSDCVRRAFDRLMTDPSMKTQKGKKALARMLTQIEAELVGSVGSDSEAAKALHEAVESMQDELQMETIAAEYVKKRKAIEASEERILRYMRMKGLDHLSESEFGSKLTEMGLDSAGWGALMGKSGLGLASTAGMPAPPPIPGAAAFTSLTLDHLASLIDHIEIQLTVLEDTGKQASGKDDGNVKAVATSISDANRDVQKVLSHTEDKVRALVQSVQEDDAVVRAMELFAHSKGQGPRLSRRRMIEILAEIVQEICQPLAVINCSLDLVLTRALGDIPAEQLEMLVMAKQSVDRTQVIVEQLKELSGMPETRSPDQQILGDMYNQHGLA